MKILTSIYWKKNFNRNFLSSTKFIDTYTCTCTITTFDDSVIPTLINCSNSRVINTDIGSVFFELHVTIPEVFILWKNFQAPDSAWNLYPLNSLQCLHNTWNCPLTKPLILRLILQIFRNRLNRGWACPLATIPFFPRNSM